MSVGQRPQCLHSVNAEVGQNVGVSFQHTDVRTNLLGQLHTATLHTLSYHKV